MERKKLKKPIERKRLKTRGDKDGRSNIIIHSDTAKKIIDKKVSERKHIKTDPTFEKYFMKPRIPSWEDVGLETAPRPNDPFCNACQNTPALKIRGMKDTMVIMLSAINLVAAELGLDDGDWKRKCNALIRWSRNREAVKLAIKKKHRRAIEKEEEKEANKPKERIRLKLKKNIKIKRK